jgi:serine/threonine protein kinase
MGEVFAGRYELVDPLAAGGYGTVWRVWDRREQTYRVAKVLKQSNSESLLRFVREAGRRINHPHVVMPIGWVGEDERVLITMPLVRGGSLAGLIREYGRLPLDYALEVTDQLLDALAAVHGSGLIHRDVKPANVLLEPTIDGIPDVRLGDFGIATPLDEPRLTQLHGVIGTPGYLSPEAVAGADPDPRQDLYAVGAVLVEMLLGQKPSRTEPVTVPPGLPWEVAAFIGSLVAPVGQRLPSAVAARQALAGIVTPSMPPGAIEVVDQTPPLPEGWGPHGPDQPATRTRRVRAQEVDPTHAVMPGQYPTPYSPTPGTPPPWTGPSPVHAATPFPRPAGQPMMPPMAPLPQQPVQGWQAPVMTAPSGPYLMAPPAPHPGQVAPSRPKTPTITILMRVSMGVAAVGLLLVVLAFVI